MAYSITAAKLQLSLPLYAELKVVLVFELIHKQVTSFCPEGDPEV